MKDYIKGIKLTNIVWETNEEDPEKLGLPKEVYIPVEKITEIFNESKEKDCVKELKDGYAQGIKKWLNEEYGYWQRSFDMFLELAERPKKEIDVINVKKDQTELYIVEGDYNTDLEGLLFAVCTTEDKAKEAARMLLDGEDLRITKIIADSVIVNDKVVMI